MSAFSISSVAASSAQAPGQSDAPASASDNSPFAVLLAAITAADPELQAPGLQTPELQAPEPQTATQPGAIQAATVADGQPSPLPQATQPGVTQAAPVADAQPSSLPIPPAANDDDNANDIDADTAIVTTASVADPKTDIVQDPSLDPSSAPKSGTKPDKKAHTDKTEPDIAAAPPQPQIPVLPQPPIAPMAQAAVQTQVVASNDNDSDAVLGIAASSAAYAPPATSIVRPVPPDPNVSQPVVSDPSQAEAKPAATPPQPLTAANDESADDSDVLANIAPADQAKPAAHLTEVKFTPARNPGSKPVSQAAPQPQAPATVDEDADPAIEPSGTQTIAANTLPQTVAQTTPQSSLEDMAQVSAVPPAPQKPDTPDKPAPNKIVGMLAPTADTAAANAKDPVQDSKPTPPTTANNDSDGKPAHVAASAAPQAQPDAPQPPAHAPINPVPQAPLVINPVSTNSAGGLTLSVHVASHDTDSQSSTPPAVTPDTDALAISVAARSLSGSKQFDIRLDPPELGRVEVRLSIDASGKTQAHMTADQPQTLELLQKDAPNLTRALRDAGLDVSQNGLNFSLKGQGQNGGGQNGNFGNASRSLSLPAIAQGIEAAQPANTAYPLPGNVRLDIHV